MKQAISNYQQHICEQQCAIAAEKTAGIWSEVIETLNCWSQRTRTRRHLAKLSATELEDVGISTAQAQREIDKPFWLK